MPGSWSPSLFPQTLKRAITFLQRPRKANLRGENLRPWASVGNMFRIWECICVCVCVTFSKCGILVGLVCSDQRETTNCLSPTLRHSSGSLQIRNGPKRFTEVAWCTRNRHKASRNCLRRVTAGLAGQREACGMLPLRGSAVPASSRLLSAPLLKA